MEDIPMAGTFVINKRSNGEFQFNLKAGNGLVILTSEGYKAKPSCLEGVASVRKNSQDDKRFSKQTASNGKLYFNLTATNSQTIGTSQMYADESGRNIGIASVKTNAPDAQIVDETV
jgi:uncharacterized protein